LADKKLEFEDCISAIDKEIAKRKNKWSLSALSWMDFDDVSQIIRIHVYKKWHLFDQNKPLAPWLNRIISNQIKNLIRNNYGNYARPCLKCAASEGTDLCTIYEKQDSTCPLYANWVRSKQIAHNIKLPVPLENHSQEIYSQQDDKIDINENIERVHKKMKEILKPIEWKVYRLLYIDHKNEEEAAKSMGYRTTEKGRSPGYKQIKNIKRTIIKKVKASIENGSIDIY
jgi:RNA polymerase sigma factor (sigma-70 family)